jgi:hypothetical protein
MLYFGLKQIFLGRIWAKHHKPVIDRYEKMMAVEFEDEFGKDTLQYVLVVKEDTQMRYPPALQVR